MKEINKDKAWFLLYRLSLDECVVELEGELYKFDDSLELVRLDIPYYNLLMLRLRCLHVIPDPVLSIGAVRRVMPLLGSARLTLTNDSNVFLSEARMLDEILKTHKDAFTKSVGLDRLRGDWILTPIQNLGKYDIVSYTSVPTTPFIYMGSEKIVDKVNAYFMLVNGSIFQMMRMANSSNEIRRYAPFLNKSVSLDSELV